MSLALLLNGEQLSGLRSEWGGQGRLQRGMERRGQGAANLLLQEGWGSEWEGIEMVGR